jgi:hypothetical protein
MKISVDEIVKMKNLTNDALDRAYKRGVQDERERALPNTLFDTLLKYGIESETLLESHISNGLSDGCHWIQLKPTRDGSEGTKDVEISFQENLTEIDFVGIVDVEPCK